MKKKIIIIITLLCLVGIGTYVYIVNQPTDEEKYQIQKEKDIETIMASDFIKKTSTNATTIKNIKEKIAAKDEFVVYLGWYFQCGDSRHFELNAYNNYATKYPSLFDKMLYLNLEDDLLEGVSDKEVRIPVAKDLLIDTWTNDSTVSPMKLYGPQMIYYKDGKIVDLVSWTPGNNDNKLGIQEELVIKFLDNVSKSYK